MIKQNEKLNPEKMPNSNNVDNIPDGLLDNLLLPSKQLEELKEQIFNSPDINQNKIDFFKEEITADRYQIEPDIIARKLLDEQLPMLEEEPELA